MKRNKLSLLLRTGIALMFVGAFLTMFIIGAILGVPMMVAGVVCIIISIARGDLKKLR